MPYIHILPINDLEPHNEQGNWCACSPTIEDTLVIHNSFDGREAAEEAEEIIKQRLEELS